MAGKPKYTNESIVAALAQTNGTVYLAAEALGCDSDTIFRRVHKSAAVAAAVRHHKGRRVDNAERKLDAAVERGEPWAVALVLCTLGKDRGYVKQTDVRNVPSDEEIQRAIDAELARLGRGGTMAGGPGRNGCPPP
jgi:transposase-like protein